MAIQGDLGAIDAKYDVAISSSTPKLDFIVADTSATAQAGIKFLRDNNVGRVDFIPLDKLDHLVPHMERQQDLSVDSLSLSTVVVVKMLFQPAAAPVRLGSGRG